MLRLAREKILEWKISPRRKPLVVRGARQVGKTWLVRQALGGTFEHVAEIDFEARRDVHKYFEQNLEPEEILKGLELVTGKIIPGRTLLFFDEIQACPRAIMSLRYFYEKLPALHVVAAGSLLEFALSEVSVPVGRIQYLHLYPMTFYEYLLAVGKEPMAEIVRDSQENVSESIQNEVLGELKNFFFVGGMPEAVKAYRDSKSLLTAFEVQDEIIESYRDDFAKYTPRVAVECIDSVFLSVARSIGEQLIYTRLDEGHTYQTNRKAFDLLSKAGVIHKIMSCDPSGLPLGASANPKKFKAALLDIGLLQRLCQVPVNIEIGLENLLAIYKGRLAEQFVAQELVARQRQIFYWTRNARGSNAEVDYLTVKEGRIYPVEVKSGPSGRLRSLHLMLQKYPNCPEGLIMHSGPYDCLKDRKLRFLPLYATPYLADESAAI